MGKIFCLMGKSSSGKDTIFKLLKNDANLNLVPFITYTTRPIRNNETNGVEYFFIDEEKLQYYEKAGKIIEKRVYHTVNGPWYYCTIDDGQIDLTKNNYVLISTLEAYKNIQTYFKPCNVVPVYIEVDDTTRLERAIEREKQQQNPNFDELHRRFFADNADFSPDKLIESNINKHYNNVDLEKCVKQISEDIFRMTGEKL